MTASKIQAAICALIIAISVLFCTEILRAQETDPLYEYGEYLATQCASCHLEASSDAPTRSGLLDIWALPVEELSVRFTVSKRRSENDAARSVVESLTDEEIEALLHFFAIRAKKSAAQGEQI